MAHDRKDDHSATGPSELGSGRVPPEALPPEAVAPDLEAAERDVATWCGALGRRSAPRALRRRILNGAFDSSSAGAFGSSSAGAFGSSSAGAGRLLAFFPVARFPLGGWGLASAALLLIALGAATLVELTDGGRGAPHGLAASGDRASDASTRGSLARGSLARGSLARGVPQQAVQIVEDPSMALFHDVETFDDVGLVRGEVIADWGH